MGSSRLTRRSVLKSAVLGSAAAITAPYVRGAYAAGKLTLGCWDHWVPGDNKALDKICAEWGEKNKVEVHIDYITSQGEKDKLTAAAEAQAGTGHDIMSHRDWNIQVHQRVLEPLDDVVNELIKQHGEISPVAEYLAKIKGTWRGVPTTVGSQVKPCQSRFDLYKEHAGIDLRERTEALLGISPAVGQPIVRIRPGLQEPLVVHRRRRGLQGLRCPPRESGREKTPAKPRAERLEA